MDGLPDGATDVATDSATDRAADRATDGTTDEQAIGGRRVDGEDAFRGQSDNLDDIPHEDLGQADFESDIGQANGRGHVYINLQPDSAYNSQIND